MIALLASSAALIGVAAMLWLLRGDRGQHATNVWEVPAPAPQPRPPALVTSDETRCSEPSQCGQVLFIEPMPFGLIGLDCLLADAADTAQATRPVHVVGALPANAWVAAVELQLLQEWLGRGDVVTAEISEHGARSQVKVACERTTLLLPLQMS